MIKAIETRYKGYRFRSRLEARWAVFFDAMNIEWLYEPEGFVLDEDLGPYLPDFKVRYPGSDRWQWIEIKPDAPSIEEYLKIVDLHYKSQEHPRTVSVMLCGYPGKPKFPVVGSDGILQVAPESYFALSVTANGPAAAATKDAETGGVYLATVSCFAYTGGGKILDIWPMYAPLYDTGDGSVHGFIDPTEVFGKEPKGVSQAGRYAAIDMLHGPRTHIYAGEGIWYRPAKLLMAYNAARAARFEHGEKR